MMFIDLIERIFIRKEKRERKQGRDCISERKRERERNINSLIK